LKNLLFALLLVPPALVSDARTSPNRSGTIQRAEFSWDSRHRLTWDDFRGPVPTGRGNVAAETSCGIGFETNTITRGTPVRFRVYNTFSMQRSWVRPDAMTAEVLEHEQGHFDLCELYTRKLRARFNSTEGITVDNLKRITRSVWAEVHGEYAEQQELYEEETAHGLNREGQVAWTARLEKELAATESWASK
jgi:hypothetical protein